MHPTLVKINEKIRQQGGACYICGGFVRDYLLNKPSSDIDIEVYKIEAEKLEHILNEFGQTKITGKSFGVWKLSIGGQDFDFSLPRTDFQAGTTHTSIETQTDPFLDTKTASSRRDFTFNSMLMDFDYNIIDHHNGQDDLHFGILSATSESDFASDPLRMIRGMQFASRFNLRADEKTVYLARLMMENARHLPKERYKEEWIKWTIGSHPIKGLDFLEQSGHLQLYPDLEILKYVPQNPEYHPETNVWVHTKHVCQAMAEICDRENISGRRRTLLFFSALLHDIGKSTTTKLNKRGNWSALKHDYVGAEMVHDFLTGHLNFFKDVKKIENLVREHMAHINWKDQVKEKSVRKLAKRLFPASIEDLALLIEADVSGRPPLPKHIPQSVTSMLEISRNLEINLKPEPPKVTGEDLQQLGYVQGEYLGNALKHSYKLQMNGYDKDKILKATKGAFPLPKENK